MNKPLRLFSKSQGQLFNVSIVIQDKYEMLENEPVSSSPKIEVN